MLLLRDFFLDKQREKARLEAEMKMQVTLKQLIPAGLAQPVAPLGVILSQYYINLNEFCTYFNKETAMWEEGVPLPTKVRKGLRAKEYKVSIGFPTMTFWVKNAAAGKFRKIAFNAVWDIVRIKEKELKIGFRRTARLVFSALRTCRIRTIIGYRKFYLYAKRRRNIQK